MLQPSCLFSTFHKSLAAFKLQKEAFLLEVCDCVRLKALPSGTSTWSSNFFCVSKRRSEGSKCTLKRREYKRSLFSIAQKLQEEAGKGKELWTAVEKSHKSLVKTLHRGAAQLLGEQMEGERTRSVAQITKVSAKSLHASLLSSETT